MSHLIEVQSINHFCKEKSHVTSFLNFNGDLENREGETDVKGGKD